MTMPKNVHLPPKDTTGRGTPHQQPDVPIQRPAQPRAKRITLPKRNTWKRG